MVRTVTGLRSRPVMSHLPAISPMPLYRDKNLGPQPQREGNNAQVTEAQVISLLRTILADMTTTLDRRPVTETVYTHSLQVPSRPTHNKEGTISRWEPKALCRWKVWSGREALECKLGLLGGGREKSAQPWPGSGGGGICTQGTKGPYD